MYRFFTHRFLQGVVTILIVSIVVFVFVHASGDPAALMVPIEDATPEAIQEMRERLGTDRPLYVQYSPSWAASGAATPSSRFGTMSR